MKKILIPFILLAAVLLTGSCGGSKRVVYFQNIDTLSLAASKGQHDTKIMPKDQLSITVVTTDPAASAPFNLTVNGTVGTRGQLSSASNLQDYAVDNDGNIEFPIVGKLHVAGLTKKQCQDLIKEKISSYLSATEKPIVTVRMSSFHVTVLGEVNSSSVIPVTTEKMSIIEAIAQAGDLTLYGKRDNVMLIREDADGHKSVHRLNLKDANLINSPYYYLQQNDIVYVEPIAAKANSAQVSVSTSIWVGLASSILSLASLIVGLTK